jgi:hypothetical protein
MERGPPLALINQFLLWLRCSLMRQGMAVKLKLVVLNPSEVVAPPHPHLFNPSFLSLFPSLWTLPGLGSPLLGAGAARGVPVSPSRSGERDQRKPWDRAVTSRRHQPPSIPPERDAPIPTTRKLLRKGGAQFLLLPFPFSFHPPNPVPGCHCQPVDLVRAPLPPACALSNSPSDYYVRLAADIWVVSFCCRRADWWRPRVELSMRAGLSPGGGCADGRLRSPPARHGAAAAEI